MADNAISQAVYEVRYLPSISVACTFACFGRTKVLSIYMQA